MIDYRCLLLLGVSGHTSKIVDDGVGTLIYQQQVSTNRTNGNTGAKLIDGICDFKQLGIGVKKMHVRLYDWTVTPSSLKTDTLSFKVNWFSGWGINTANNAFEVINTDFPATYNQEFTLYAPVKNGLSPRYLVYPFNGSFIEDISENQTSILTVQLRMLIDILEYGGVPSDDYRWY